MIGEVRESCPSFHPVNHSSDNIVMPLNVAETSARLRHTPFTPYRARMGILEEAANG